MDPTDVQKNTMSATKIEKIIQNASYLLELQKELLLEELPSTEDDCWGILDEVFRQLFGKPTDDMLSTGEMIIVTKTIYDFIRE